MNAYAILLVSASWATGIDGATPPAQPVSSPVVQCCHQERCSTRHRALCHAPKCQAAPCESVILEHGCPCKQVLGSCHCKTGLLRRLLDRLMNCKLCRRNRCKPQPVCHVVCSEPVPAKPAPAPEPLKTMPEPKPAAKPAPAPQPPVQATFEIKKEYLPKVGNAADYSWITGQLFYIHAEGGLWVVRYAPHEKEDRYGGSVVLTPSLAMSSYQEGDLVTVHGGVLHEGRASKFLGGPPYRGSSMELVERLK